MKVIHNLYLKDDYGNHEIDLVLIRPNGVFSIEIKSIKGEIIGLTSNKYWSARKSRDVRYSFLNPLRQNYGHIKALQNVLGEDFRIHSLIVFTYNNVDNLYISNVIGLKDFKDYLINNFNDISYSDSTIDILFDLIKDHVHKNKIKLQ